MKEQMQYIIITMDDGVDYYFTGKAVVFPGEPRMIVDVKFTEPKDIPDDYILCEIED